MARPSRAKRKMLREKHREVSATRPAPRRHFDANGRAAMIDAWRQIVGAPSAPELAEANKLQDDAIRTRIAARGYGAAGYDLLAAAPDLACALNARPLLVLEFPLLDVLASVQSSALDFPPDPDFSSVRVVIGNQERFTSSLVRWAWIGLIARTDKGPGVALVTASQRALPSPSPALHALFDSFSAMMFSFESPQADQMASIDAVMIGSIEPHADTEISYHHAPLDAVMAAPEALREQLAQHCGVRLPAATPV